MSRFIYLHGFGSSPASTKAEFFRTRFAELGMGLEVPDLSEGDFEHLAIGKQLVLLERMAKGEPVSLIGSSMGGYLAALYGARHPEVERMLLLAPAFGMGRHFLTTIGEERANEWQRAGALPVFNYARGREERLWWGFIEDARRYEEFPETTQSVLIFHGRRDWDVPYELSVDFARQRPDVQVELVDSDHQLHSALDKIWGSAQGFFGLS